MEGDVQGQGRWQDDERLGDVRMQARTRATREVPDTTYAVRRDLSRGGDQSVVTQKN